MIVPLNHHCRQGQVEPFATAASLEKSLEAVVGPLQDSPQNKLRGSKD
jgi:hypothetical protein